MLRGQQELGTGYIFATIMEFEQQVALDVRKFHWS